MMPILDAYRTLLLSTAVLCFSLAAFGQEPAPTQTETDEYTRYELLAPESASFAISYEVTATTPGATVYFNPIRKGSVASNESVLDVMTGEPLKFEVVSGEEAVKDPLLKGGDTSVDYIKVHLARPVPSEGQARLLILKTYKDAKSYYREGDKILFNRPLGIPRNKVVLPAGYEVVACNVPSQVLREPDGRISVSFMNGSGSEAPLVVKAKPGAQIGISPKSGDRGHGNAKTEASPGISQLAETAHRDQESVLSLQQPETHSYQQTFDSTVDAETPIAFGTSADSEVADVSAYVLDTGEKLTATVMTAAQPGAAHKQLKSVIGQGTHAVVISPPATKFPKSIRIRVLETVTEPTALRLVDDELVFEWTLKYPRNAVVLPDGWYPTASSIPATVSQGHDGRVRLDFWNGGPDPLEVLVKARRRVAAR